MTIASEYQPDRYVGNDVTTVFAYNFKVDTDSYLRVLIADENDENSAELTLSTHYTISGVGEDAGGSITITDIRDLTGEATVTTVPTNWSITLKLDIPFKQTTDLHNQGGFFPETHEDALDLLCQQIQQVEEKTQRALTVSETSGESGTEVTSDLATYAVEAKASATAAASSEANAATSEANAATSEANASASEAATEAARDAVVISTHTETASASQDTITVSGFTLDADKDNIQIYIDGVRQNSNTFTRTSGTVITLDSALTGGEDIYLLSATPAATGPYHSHPLNGDTLDAIPDKTGEDDGDLMVLKSDGSIAWLANEVQIEFVVPGVYMAGGSISNDLLETKRGWPLYWRLRGATLVNAWVKTGVADTGASKAQVNIEIDGTEAFSSDADCTTTLTAATIDAANDEVANGERVELTIAGLGSNSDSEDLLVSTLWRIKGA